jgi:phage/plasmid-like protein (TIGR03299 family)
MAHELTQREDGTVEMAYAGETPWHGLGNELEHGAPIEAWIAAAGMDWSILRARVRYAISKADSDSPTSYRSFDGRCVLLRSDSKDPLGLVSDEYRPVQPREVLEFFRDLTGAAGFTLETAGTLFGGRRMWALASIGVDASILDPRDKMKAHLLLSTACDGSMATEGRYCTTRVVCNNTLTFAREEGAPKVKVNHKTRFDASSVKAELGIEAAYSTFDRTIADMRKLAATPVKPAGMVALTATLLHPDFAGLDAEKRDKVLRSKQVETIGRLAIDGAAMGSEFNGARGTAWGWLNSVTEYVDHAARAQSVDNRLNSAWFGKGNELKERAYLMALDYTPSLDDVIASTNAIFDKPKPLALLDAVLEETIL